eukprot:TRINITY_DN107226_c0_g1_i1.p1 TRINITY_DN107226_c0_g1~~TRINITY_DN107226_c0_g1_i1.p1  ORF type:complete len:354 (+),score=68.58 TRINITY_DN107226_c0_g1_i1:32-1063(+)
MVFLWYVAQKYRKHQRHLQPLAAFTLGVSLTGLGFGAAYGLQVLESPAELAEQAALAEEWDEASSKHQSAVNELRLALAGNDDALESLDVLTSEAARLLGPRPVVEVRDWTFIGSVYFTFTIISTIGYGTFAPVTVGGQVLTVIIGIFGAACFGLWLTFVGRSLHKSSRRMAKRLCKNRAWEYIAFMLAFFVAYWLLGALAFEEFAHLAGDPWQYGECVYFAAITFLTIGLGDYSLRWYGEYAELEVAVFIIFTILGLAIFIEVANVLTDALKKAYGSKAEHGQVAPASACEGVSKNGAGVEKSEDCILRDAAFKATDWDVVAVETIPPTLSQQYRVARPPRI